MRKNLLLWLALIIVPIFTLTSCYHEVSEELEEEEEVNIDYPVSIVPDRIVTNLTDEETLYPVTEDFLRDFIMFHDRFDGTQMSIETDFPEEWGVRFIERLPESKELWLLQSQNREIIYLVVTSGAGTQRILDVLPVAVNMSVQKGDVLETEVWRTTREQDGSFVVYKYYNWTRSLENAVKSDVIDNPDNYSREVEKNDIYIINEMGRFELLEQEVEQEYEAVFFFYDKSNKPDDWDEVMEIVESYCEEKGIYFDEVYQNFENVYVRDYELNDIIPMNILPYVDNASAGMVMMKNGFEPRMVTFGNEDKLKVEIRRYFKIGSSAMAL